MPSAMIRWRLLPATSITPTIIAISKPPNAASTSTGSVTSLWRALRALQHDQQARNSVLGCIAGPEISRSRSAVLGQARQHQRRALVRADADAGAGDHVAGQRVGDLHAGADGGMGLVERHRRAWRAHCGCRARSCAPAAARAAPPARPRRSRPPTVRVPGCARTPTPATASRAGRARALRWTGAPRVADAVDRQAVVGGEQRDLRRAEARLQRVLDQPQAHRQRLQLAQAAGRLAAPLQLLAQRLLEQRIGRGRDQGTIDRHGDAKRCGRARDGGTSANCAAAAALRGSRTCAQAGLARVSAQEQPVDRVVGLVLAGVGQAFEELAERLLVGLWAPGCRPGCGRSRRPGCGSGTG